jgi:hypothetical protein
VNQSFVIRVTLAVAIISVFLLTGLNTFQIATSKSETINDPYAEYESATVDVTQVAETRPNGTVFTDGGISGGHLVAINPNGTLKYYTNSYDEYYDVDPIDNNRVMVTAMQEYNRADCPADHPCSREQILVINLDTQATHVVYERFRKHTSENEWHDVDKIGEDRYLVAGMEKERVFIVNVTTGIITWSWDPQENYNITTGGTQALGTNAWPWDWTHLNDVEHLEDGRIMVSMRNHDQVIFINKTTGIESDWTLGENDNTSIMFEQHNPDYIPDNSGTPAVLVADSHNNRVVEYERQNRSWKKTWGWTDAQMQWPRDADRLPNGHTLVADSNGNRVIEINQNGSIIWSISPAASVYDVERFNTGDESTGGQSAVQIGLESRATQISTISQAQDIDASGVEYIKIRIKHLLPPILTNALLTITPWWWTWVGFDGVLLAISITCIIVDIILTFPSLKIRFPIVRDK